MVLAVPSQAQGLPPVAGHVARTLAPGRIKHASTSQCSLAMLKTTSLIMQLGGTAARVAAGHTAVQISARGQRAQIWLTALLV